MPRFDHLLGQGELYVMTYSNVYPKNAEKFSYSSQDELYVTIFQSTIRSKRTWQFYNIGSGCVEVHVIFFAINMP